MYQGQVPFPQKSANLNRGEAFRPIWYGMYRRAARPALNPLGLVPFPEGVCFMGQIDNT